MVSSEDFSFPTISYSLPNFAVSPSLWPVCSQQVYREAAREDCCNGNQVFDDEEEEEQEKMDMLWEQYFIQELKRVSSLDHMKKEVATKISDSAGVCDEVCKPLKMMSNTTACGNSNSRLAMIKLVKKIFLINNLGWIKKNI